MFRGMKRARLLITLVLLAAVAGCASGGHRAHPSGKPTPDQAQMTWMEKVCAADEDLRTQQSAAETAALYIAGRSSTPKQIAGFVTAVRKGLEKNVKKFQKAGKANIDGGDRVTAAYISAVKHALTKIKGDEKTAKDTSVPEFVLTAIPHRVSLFVQDAVPQGADLPHLTARDPIAKQAFKKAKSCGSPLTATPSPSTTG